LHVAYALRQGLDWDDKQYTIDAPYCVKTEFHQSGWAHFHVLFLTRRFIPAQLIEQLWGLGRINVKRISGNDFRYLLKYVTKGGGQLPNWVMQKKRMRIFQPSHGFLKAISPAISSGIAPQLPANKPTRASITIAQRLRQWARMAKLSFGNTARAFKLVAPFRQLFDEHILTIALDGRYLGRGKILINETRDLIQWMLTGKQMAGLYCRETDFIFEGW